MIDNISKWAWNTPSIDEFWDNVLKDKNEAETKSLITSLPEGHLQEYLTLKIRYGIGRPIIMVSHKKNGRMATYDIRDFEAFVKYKNALNNYKK